MGGEFEGRNCVESLTADEGEDEGGQNLENGKKRAERNSYSGMWAMNDYYSL